MPLKVLPATTADAPRAIEIENQAYGHNPLTTILFPGPAPQPAGSSMPDYRLEGLVSQLRDSPDICRWWKVIDTDLVDEASSQDDMIAFSMWCVYKTPRGKGRLPARQWGSEANKEACDRYFGTRARAYDELWGDKPHIFFKNLHTEPEHQRRGAGSLLVGQMTLEADALGLPTFLEASNQGNSLYRKYGFEESNVMEVDFTDWGGPSGWKVTHMTRQPRT